MTKLDKTIQPPPSASSIVRFWERIPMAVRAIFVGLLVVSILSTVALNLILILIPAPWSGVALAIVFWAYLRYFSGSWGPKATSESRRVRFRATKLPMRVWLWSLIAALLTAVFFQSSIVVLCRIIECIPLAPAAVLGADLPIWQIWLFILMAAGVNGIAEEVGFRGYMQVPLEGRYGPAVGITITSIAFALFHLNQAWASGVGILVILFVGAAMWGVIALTSGSLIPVILSHIIVDINYFLNAWTNFDGVYDNRPIGEAGIDTHFILWLVGLVASVVLFVFAARRTLAARQEK